MVAKIQTDNTHPLLERPRSLLDKISGKTTYERAVYGPRGGWLLPEKKKRSGMDMLKGAMQKLSGSTTFTNPNAGKFPKTNYRGPAQAKKKPSFTPKIKPSNGIGVGY